MNIYETNRDYMPLRGTVTPNMNYISYSLSSMASDLPKVAYTRTNISDMKMSYEKKE